MQKEKDHTKKGTVHNSPENMHKASTANKDVTKNSSVEADESSKHKPSNVKEKPVGQGKKK